MTTDELQTVIRDAFRSLDAVAESAIRRELAQTADLGHSGRLQFEACPCFFGVKLVQTGDEIVGDSAIADAIPLEHRAAAVSADLDVYGSIEAELPLWLADRWQAAAGPEHYRPAYLLFHGGLNEPRFDLEQRRWCEVSEVWPEG